LFTEIDENSIPDVGVGTVDSRIKKACDYRSVPMITKVFMPLLHSGDNMNLQWLEQKFRSLDTTVYALAAPERLFSNPPQTSFCFIRKKKMPYFLWFAVNGLAEAEGFMKNFGLAKSYEENFKLLADTGFSILTSEYQTT